MTSVACLTPDQIDIRVEDPMGASATYCLRHYYEELAQVFEHGFDVGRSRDPRPDQMTPPQGAFLVATAGGLPVGCVGLKGLGRGDAEVKRLWVAPGARGLGLARRLMEAVEDTACTLSIVRLRLDSNRALAGALALYRQAGWTAIDRFNDDPYADYFFEKVLTR